MREIHGVAGATRRNDKSGSLASVRVTDGTAGNVELIFGFSDVFVELTSGQARFLAKCLAQSAQRVEKANKV